jgi:hypothetical protein
MKYFQTLFLISALTSLWILPSCKKEEREPTINAASLFSGRAAIKFTASKSINGNKAFDINNTASTTASNQSMGVGNIRNIILEATELYENAPIRKAIINMAVRENMTTPIDLSLTSGLPLGFIHIDSYALFGYTRRSQSGTITLTRFTATEIEGRFTATFDDGTVVNDGRFAGKF